MAKRSIKIKHYFLKSVNPVIRFLILSDVIIVSGVGLLTPIFAIFIEDFIPGANATTAGLAAGVYLFSKSVLQIPIAHFIDKVRGERDDFWLMFVFTVLMSLIPLFYLIINTPLQLFMVQFLLGLFTAFTFPTYMAIFTRHIDKKKEGMEWGLYFTLVDLSAALFATIGGYLAASHGFHFLIMTVSAISFTGALLLYPIRPYLNFKKQPVTIKIS